MSTKIWTAVRVPIPKLNEYLKLCRAETMKQVFEQAEWQITKMDWDAARVEAEADIAKSKYREIEQVTRRYALRMLAEEYRKSSTNFERRIFDVDSSVNIWLDDKFAYIIPYGKTVLAEIKYAEDYHYQNQVDKPENVSNREWKAREKKWDEVALDDWNATRLQHEFVSFALTNWESLFNLELHFGLHPGHTGNNDEWKPNPDYDYGKSKQQKATQSIEEPEKLHDCD